MNATEMGKILKLTRSLVILDLETTSADVKTAKIVSIGIVRIHPHGSLDDAGEIEIKVNPGCHIPEEASKIHGITDEMVQHLPPFAMCAKSINEMIAGCDIAGFNIVNFDLPILRREMEEAGIIDFAKSAQVVDVMTIFHKNFKRDLTSAVRFYLDRYHEGAHGALADSKATAEILIQQIAGHGLPNDVDGLCAYCNQRDPSFVDKDGKLIWQNGHAVFNFGTKVKGMTLQQAKMKESRFLQWILRNDFSAELKEIIEGALNDKYPVQKI